MPPAPQSPATRRAARAGKNILKRNLPPGLFEASKRIAKNAPDADGFWALAGALAAIALGLERGFLQSGTIVRDFTWTIHSLLNGEELTTLPEFSEFEDFQTWMREWVDQTNADDHGRSKLFRPMLFNWIDVANERLTLRRYARPDHLEHHARILIARPLTFVFGPGDAPGGREAGSTLPSQVPDEIRPDDIAFGEFLLRFFDLLDIERQNSMGRNRIRRTSSDNMGGFYGVSEEFISADPGEENEAHEKFLADIDSLNSSDVNTFYRNIIDKMAVAVRIKMEKGSWPTAYRLRGPRERLPWLMRLRVGSGK